MLNLWNLLLRLYIDTLSTLESAREGSPTPAAKPKARRAPLLKEDEKRLRKDKEEKTTFITISHRCLVQRALGCFLPYVLSVSLRHRKAPISAFHFLKAMDRRFGITSVVWNFCLPLAAARQEVAVR